VLALFHHESVTLAEELAEPVLPADELVLLELPLLHAAAAVAVATATAMAAIARLLRISHLLEEVGPRQTGGIHGSAAERAFRKF